MIDKNYFEEEEPKNDREKAEALVQMLVLLNIHIHRIGEDKFVKENEKYLSEIYDKWPEANTH